MAERALHNQGIPKLLVDGHDENFTDPNSLFLRNITHAKKAADGIVNTMALDIKLGEDLNKYLNKDF